MSGVIICWNFFFLQIRIFNTCIRQLIFINKCQLGQNMFLQCTKIALPLIYDTCLYLNIKSMQKISLRFKFLIFFFLSNSKTIPTAFKWPFILYLHNISNYWFVGSPLRRILSSNVALKAPSGVFSAFFTCPRIPLTVRILAPSNFVTSRMELNMPCGH